MGRFRNTCSATAMVAALLVIGSQQAVTQEPPLRSGFWAGIDGGYGRMALTNCSSCEPAGIPVASIRFGGTIGSSMLAGAEFGLGGRAAGLPSLATLLGTVSFYPVPRAGAHVRLGFGAIGRGRYSNVDGLAMLAFMGGAGYAIRVRRGMSIVPSVSVVIGPGSYATSLLRATLGIASD